MHTRDTLVRDLRTLGVRDGDTLFVHSSFKSLGTVSGGAQTVVDALMDGVGGGLLLMPSFNLVEGGRDARAARWDPATAPATVGWLTEYFRQMPGTVRSDHYSHSVAARGTDAQSIVDGHRLREGMRSPWDRPPWGRTYGTHSPMIRAYQRGGRLLMLGVDYGSSTYVHVVESMLWAERRRSNPEAAFVGLDRPSVGAVWDRSGRVLRGRVGDAECRLFGIRDYVDTLLSIAREDPERYSAHHRRESG